MSANTSLPVANKKTVTLVYWVVGLAGLLLFIAMLLPAVQQAHESSHRASAANRATQVGEALQNHHDVYAKHFGSVKLDELNSEHLLSYAALPALPLAVDSVSKPSEKSKDNADLPTASGGQSERHERKIVYSASVQLAVEDFAGVGDKVAELVKKFDGYVAGSNQSGTSGESRNGSWKIRVPVARFDDFVAAAKQLGEVMSAGTSSQDVSEEFYDVDARIRNKTKEEERLLKLLEDRPGKLEDVIAIERELSRVREELERMQGRMRVLADLSSLTTVELSIAEIKNYQPEDAPSLATRTRRSFDASLSALGTTGADLLVLGAALLVWLPILAVLLCGFWMFVRRQLRRSHGTVLRQDVP